MLSAVRGWHEGVGVAEQYEVGLRRRVLNGISSLCSWWAIDAVQYMQESFMCVRLAFVFVLSFFMRLWHVNGSSSEAFHAFWICINKDLLGLVSFFGGACFKSL